MEKINKINLNTFLNRDEECNKIKTFLKEFEENKNNLLIKRGLYLYGNSGCGKTTFVMNLLREMGYDPIKYDAGDVRSKSIIETITKHNSSDKNVMSMFETKIKKIVLVMDEIDGMNNGDKGGINSLIKIIRPKKTKRQKNEEITNNPIICIGNYVVDKKIKELMKVCHVIELKSPTNLQIQNILNNLCPDILPTVISNILEFIQNDLRKLIEVINLYKNNKKLIVELKDIFYKKYYEDDTRQITKKILNTNYKITDHSLVMNETDRTIVGLLWHENIIDTVSKIKKNNSIPFYLKILNNTCLSDYIDRITFQKQIWQFNEMTSLIKTFKNNKIYHDTFNKLNKFNPTEVRFTKVLTKYSTEFNNSTFIQNLCQQLGMDKKDMFSYFIYLKNNFTDNEILLMLEHNEIKKLDINRIYRYINKYTNENCEQVYSRHSDEDDVSDFESDEYEY